MSTSVADVGTALVGGCQDPDVGNDADGTPLKQQSDQERSGGSPRPARPPRPERPRPPVDRSPHSNERRQRPERPQRPGRPPCPMNHSPRPVDHSPRPVDHSSRVDRSPHPERPPRPEQPPRPSCPPRPDRPAVPPATERPQPRVPRRQHQTESAFKQPRPHSQPDQSLVDRPKSPIDRPTTQPGTQPATRPTTQLATRPSTRPGTQLATRPTTQPGTKPATRPTTQPVTRPTTRPATKLTTRPATQPATKLTTRSADRPRTQRPNSSQKSLGERFKSFLGEHNIVIIDGDEWACRKCGTVNKETVRQCHSCGLDRTAGRGRSSTVGGYTTRERERERETATFGESLAQLFGYPQPHFSEEKNTPTSSPNPRTGFWSCSNCTYENPLASTQCAMCQTSVEAKADIDSETRAVTSVSLTELSEGESHTLTMQQIRKVVEDEALAQWLTIVEECKSKKCCFKDPDFPSSDKSLYIDPSAPVKKWPVHGWVRCSQTLEIPGSFSRHDEWTVYRNPCSSDIAQGMVGDCWFMSALAVVAEIPELLQQIVINKEYCPEGVYQVRLCKDGLWKVLIVDDWLPCLINKQLIFSNVKRRQLWVPLIEKGLAKLFGCYEAIEKHRISIGLSILTGYPCGQLVWKGTDPGDTEGSVDPQEVWERMLTLKAHHYPMGAQCGRKFINREEYEKVGLQYEHGYSILDVQQDEALRVIKLRNPWGKSSWTGWRWQKDHDAEVSGIFWMGAPDFFKYFLTLDYCQYHPLWHSARVKGTISPNSKQVVSFKVTTATEIEFTLYQPTYYGAEATSHPPNCIAMMVLEVSQLDNSVVSLPKSLVVASEGTHDSTVWCSAFFNPGHYAVLPLVFGKETDGEFSYVLALFSARPVVMNGPALPQPGFTAESLFHFGRQSGRMTKARDTLVTYQFEFRPSFYFLMAENRDSQMHYTIACSLTLDNLVSTRGSPVTKDRLPPKHRQVIYMLYIADVRGRTSGYQVGWQVESSRLGVQQKAEHSPPVTQSMADMHSPRFIK